MTSSERPPRIEVLEVQDLRLVDKDGSTLARLGRNEFGAFGLAIGESANGSPMITLKVTAGGEPCVEIRDREGHCRALLEVNRSNGAVLMGLLDENQKARTVAAVAQDGTCTLAVHDVHDKSRVYNCGNGVKINELKPSMKQEHQVELSTTSSNVHVSFGSTVCL
jgi:hypothetical protein